MPDVIAVVVGTAVAVVGDIREMDSVIDQIAALDGVLDTETKLAPLDRVRMKTRANRSGSLDRLQGESR